MSSGRGDDAIHAYGKGFFEGQVSGARTSAAAIVPLVMGVVRPSSVVDVGCGVGAWLAAFIEAGVSDVVGVDGSYVDPTQLEIPAELFVPADLAAGFSLDRRFDLVVSLEVGEHLPEASAASFVAGLVGLGPAILFSAAIPGQGGEHHVNERWPAYWLSMFDAHGYEPFDCIRPSVWSEPIVEFWYAQNTLLLLAPEIGDGIRARARTLGADRAPLPLVHPRLLELSSNRQYSVSQLAGMLARRIRDAALRRLSWVGSRHHRR